MIEIRDVIYRTVRRVAEDEGVCLKDLSDDSSLVDDIGLRSLDIARILAILEMELAFDPFATGELPLTDIRTVRDLCGAYNRVMEPEAQANVVR
jgi:acyl carrier protein